MLLRAHLPAVQIDQPGAAKFEHVESCESEEGREAIEEFWLRAVDSRCEGLMIKVRDMFPSPDSLENLLKASGR
jgi:DNA ligase-1